MGGKFEETKDGISNTATLFFGEDSHRTHDRAMQSTCGSATSRNCRFPTRPVPTQPGPARSIPLFLMQSVKRIQWLWRRSASHSSSHVCCAEENWLREEAIAPIHNNKPPPPPRPRLNALRRCCQNRLEHRCSPCAASSLRRKWTGPISPYPILSPSTIQIRRT